MHKSDASVEKDRLGTIHGVSSTCAAIARIIAPSFTGVLWESSPTMNFAAIGLVCVIAFLLTTLLEREDQHAPQDEEIE